MTELADLTISEASRLLDGRQISSVELIEATLRRLEQTEPHVHAYALVAGDEALDAARAADAVERWGPLHGIPFAAKDVLASEGLATEAGSAVLAGHVPDADATAIARLRRAGAILVGKHVTHEFATGQDAPPTRNAWRLEDYPGGSSAGAGASVAVGSCLLALGTDAGGSVRVPAAVNGVTGLKATYGRVSAHGSVRGATVPSVEHLGFVTRTAADAALVLPALAGPDPADPRTYDLPPLELGSAADVAGLRLGVIAPEDFGVPADDEVQAAADCALTDLRALGADAVSIRMPALRLAVPAASTIIAAEVGADHLRWLRERPGDYRPETRRFLAFTQLIPLPHLQAAYRAQAVVRDAARELFRAHRLDAVVSPATAAPSMPMDELDPARDMDRLIQYTCPWSLVGQPALTVPCGLTRAGRPIGLQIVGRPGDEATVLRVGRAYQRRTGWHDARPPWTVRLTEPDAAPAAGDPT